MENVNVRNRWLTAHTTLNVGICVHTLELRGDKGTSTHRMTHKQLTGIENSLLAKCKAHLWNEFLSEPGSATHQHEKRRWHWAMENRIKPHTAASRRRLLLLVLRQTALVHTNQFPVPIPRFQQPGRSQVCNTLGASPTRILCIYLLFLRLSHTL